MENTGKMIPHETDVKTILEQDRPKLIKYEIWGTPSPGWYCIKKIYQDGDFKVVGNGKLKDCKLWVDCMNYQLEQASENK